ncbi:MAG TPA: hydantoinase/oxoprolinase family protein, partial [Limnochordia bacterium]
GGTSTDVTLLPGRLSVTTEASIDGWPIRVPVLDIHTIGAGGGSIAWLDPGGALQVGPQSAGADPGPACYGRGGTAPTVTDANLVLGRLPAAGLLGGRLQLDAAAARRALQGLADELGCTVEEAAWGVVQVVNARMERALRVISVERGHDPADFALISFGGAGGLHACDLARSLGIREVIVPPDPGVFSAQGMALADVVKTYSRGILRPLDAAAVAEAAAIMADLIARAGADLAGPSGGTEGEIRLEAALDLRYAGQSFELTIPVALPQAAGASARGSETSAPLSPAAVDALAAAFHTAHSREFGYAFFDEPIELVTARLRAARARAPATVRAEGSDSGSQGPEEQVQTYFGGGWRAARLIPRGALTADASLPGPAIITEAHATTLVPPGFRLRLDPSGALLITID